MSVVIVSDAASFVELYKGNVIPLRVILASLTWVLHDYFATLRDEIEYIWPQKFGTAKFLFLWIRYYTIVLLILHASQLHMFGLEISRVPKDTLCIIMDPVTRVAGAISLWLVEIAMQMRIYALYRSSKKVAIFNGVLFCISVTSFIAIMTSNAISRKGSIAGALNLPLPGCPAINPSHEWALWIPATIYEVILFGFAVFKAIETSKTRINSVTGMSLLEILVTDNILYFLFILCILIFSNVMASNATLIPWLSFGPFYASVGIVTSRMFIHLRKYTLDGPGVLDTKQISELKWNLSSI